jgi:pSer/pThr/pTyr-binding forkhead associated (FHA) protein
MLDGQELLFKNRMSCTVGRARDCQLQIPGSPAFLDVWRRHCLFEIDPPNVCVRDLGSLNGTFVNDRNIGQRARNLSRESHTETEAPSVALKDGDMVRIGPVVLGVRISMREETATCATLASESALPSPAL